MKRELREKVIVITGGSSGIGAAAARACAEAGMHVTLAARREEKLRAVAADIEQTGRRAEVVACDVTRDEDVRQLFHQSREAHGRLDALFANAGYGLSAATADLNEADHRELFEVNYFGMLRCIHAALPDLRHTPDGLKHLLVSCSIVSEAAPPMHGAYAATKAAQDSIATAMRAELAEESISVTSLYPVGTRTEFFQQIDRRSGNRGGSDLESNTPRMFMQSPERVARGVVSALRRPRAEVWPMPLARLAVALSTALPGMTASSMRKQMARQRKLENGG